MVKKVSKKVHIKCNVPFAKYPSVSVPWVDIWIFYFIGRKKIRQMLTLKWSGKLDEQIKQLKEQNKMMREITKERLVNPPPRRTDEEKAEEESKGIYRFDPDWEPKVEWYEDENTEVVDLQWAKEYFENHPEEEFCIDDMSNDMNSSREKMTNGYFYILVNRLQLSKKDIEDAVTWYLKKHKQVKPSVNIRWKKCNRFIWPV